MSQKTDPENVTILVDFPERPGVRAVGLEEMSTEELAQKSAAALDKAMSTLRGMAARAVNAVKDLTDPPDTLELAFGLTLDAEVGALVAKSDVESAINVKLAWKRDEGPETPKRHAGFLQPTE